jgi:hypothetical protein
MYYLRTQAARDAIKFTVNSSQEEEKKIENKKIDLIDEGKVDSTASKGDIHIIDDDDPGLCLSCGA